MKNTRTNHTPAFKAIASKSCSLPRSSQLPRRCVASSAKSCRPSRGSPRRSSSSARPERGKRSSRNESTSSRRERVAPTCGSTAERFLRRCSRARSSATSAVRSRARCEPSLASSNAPTTERSFSTRWVGVSAGLVPRTPLLVHLLLLLHRDDALLIVQDNGLQDPGRFVRSFAWKIARSDASSPVTFAPTLARVD